MPRLAPKEKLKKKVLERWENEGGKVLDRPVDTPDGPEPDGVPDGPVSLKQTHRRPPSKKANVK